LGATFLLVRGAFHAGSKAAHASDGIIYDAERGKLYYEPDGKGAEHQELFSTLSKSLNLSDSDFPVV
jgi:hypothetical protein